MISAHLLHLATSTLHLGWNCNLNHSWPPYEGDKLIGRFTLGNNGGQNVHLDGYGVRLRRNSTDYWDFLNTSGYDLGPGQTVRFDQNNERPLATGHYRAEITWKDSLSMTIQPGHHRTWRVSVSGFVTDVSVNQVTVIVDGLSQIRNARWRVPIYH